MEISGREMFALCSLYRPGSGGTGRIVRLAIQFDRHAGTGESRTDATRKGTRCNPVRRNANYPEDIRAAHARVAVQSGAAMGQTCYVPANRGSSQSGIPGN
ncbi:hypothetical protein B0G77_2662 [Paraburkholderia sp. BL10I2N1]|nr:hypothetical protein B0G77_2662 [Paraburkholderia sp. BL10I2N1]